MSTTPNSEYAQLAGECAALRASLALLITGLHGKHDFGTGNDWRDGTMQRAAADLAGRLDDPNFAAGFEKLAQDVLSFTGRERRS